MAARRRGECGLRIFLSARDRHQLVHHYRPIARTRFSQAVNAELVGLDWLFLEGV
jgi:hypothetical protein